MICPTRPALKILPAIHSATARKKKKDMRVRRGITAAHQPLLSYTRGFVVG